MNAIDSTHRKIRQMHRLLLAMVLGSLATACASSGHVRTFGASVVMLRDEREETHAERA